VTADDASAVAVVGGLAYLADDLSGLRVIDVSDPTAPAEVGSIAFPFLGLSDIEVLDGRAYVLGDDELRVIDVSNPAAPVEIGALDVRGGLDIEVMDGLAYVVTGNSRLEVIDVSNPAAPVELDRPSFPPPLPGLGPLNALELAPGGGLAYVATRLALFPSGGPRVPALQVLDVSDPVFPFVIGTFIAADRAGISRDVEVQDGRAYLLSSQRLWVIDVSNPAGPTLRWWTGSRTSRSARPACG
jgi:hypothetical protein